MSDEDQGEGRTGLRVERLLPAPIRAVFEAWTDPALMSQWLSPTGRAAVEADVRVGGSFRVVMLGDGMQLEHTGDYLLIDPPRKLVFTWRSPYTGEGPSVVTVVLTPRGSETHLLLTHEKLPEEATASHESGWGSILDHLGLLLGAIGRRAPR